MPTACRFRRRRAAARFWTMVHVSSPPRLSWSSYSEWLTTTDVPMLHLYVTPGLINPEASVQWSRTHIHTIEQQHMGVGGHFFQEDHAVEIGAAIRDWLGRVVSAH